jgi:hypothetical protein
MKLIFLGLLFFLNFTTALASRGNSCFVGGSSSHSSSCTSELSVKELSIEGAFVVKGKNLKAINESLEQKITKIREYLTKMIGSGDTLRLKEKVRLLLGNSYGQPSNSFEPYSTVQFVSIKLGLEQEAKVDEMVEDLSELSLEVGYKMQSVLYGNDASNRFPVLYHFGNVEEQINILLKSCKENAAKSMCGEKDEKCIADFVNKAKVTNYSATSDQFPTPDNAQNTISIYYPNSSNLLLKTESIANKNVKLSGSATFSFTQEEQEDN